MHTLKSNQAQIVPTRMSSRIAYEIYRPDGPMFIKLVRTLMTEQAAIDYCNQMNWEIVR